MKTQFWFDTVLLQQLWNRILNSLGDVSEKCNNGTSTVNDLREFSGNIKKDDIWWFLNIG